MLSSLWFVTNAIAFLSLYYLINEPGFWVSPLDVQIAITVGLTASGFAFGSELYEACRRELERHL